MKEQLKPKQVILLSTGDKIYCKEKKDDWSEEAEGIFVDELVYLPERQGGWSWKLNSNNPVMIMVQHIVTIKPLKE